MKEPLGYFLAYTFHTHHVRHLEYSQMERHNLGKSHSNEKNVRIEYSIRVSRTAHEHMRAHNDKLLEPCRRTYSPHKIVKHKFAKILLRCLRPHLPNRNNLHAHSKKFEVNSIE